MKILQLMLILCLLITNIYAEESDYRVHILQKGESISEVIAGHNIGKLYGENEWVEKVLKLNRLNQTSAKRLEIGSAIIIPLKTQYLEAGILESNYLPKNRVQSLYSEWNKERELDKYRPKKHEVSLTTGVAQESLTLKSSDQDISLDQNIEFNIGYKNNRPEIRKYAPIASLNVLSRGSVQIIDEDSTFVELSPAFKLAGGIEYTFENQLWSVAPTVAYENFTFIDFEEDNFKLVNANLGWISAKVNRIFNDSFQRYILGVEVSAADQFSGRAATLSLAGKINYHYLWEGYYRSSILELSQVQSSETLGAKIGYRF